MFNQDFRARTKKDYSSSSLTWEPFPTALKKTLHTLLH